jgi:O-antigen/teichoic acid export membrane protein
MNILHNKFLSQRWAAVNTTFALQLFNIQRFIATFLSGVVLVKLGWTGAVIESYEYLLLLFGIFTFFWISGSQNALLSIIPKTEEEHRSRFLKNALTTVLVFGAIASIALFFVGPYLFETIDPLALKWLAFYTFLNIPSLFIHIKYLLEDKPKAILVFGTVNFIAQFFFVAIPAALGYDLIGVIKFLVVLSGLRFLFFLFASGVSFDHSTRYRSWQKKWFLLAIPLSLHMLIGVSPEYIDAILVEFFVLEEGAYAVYKYGARELPLVISLITAVGTAALPMLSINEQGGLAMLKEKTRRLSHVLFPVSILLMFLSPFLFKFFYNSSFIDSALVFNIYMLILITRLIMPQVLITARQNNYFLLLCGAIEFTANVLVSLLLVKSYGLYGIALGTVVGNLIQKLALCLFVRKKYRIPFSDYIPIRTIAFYSISLLISFWLSRGFTWF